jgi:hypothetical protein
MSETIADMAYRTVSVLKDITLELPKARSPQEVASLLLREDRKMHIGIALVVLAVLVVILNSA